ncbi:CLUMA_CG000822, isoform A [Clunio marinus]|uniref:cathepsin L n=1 Tax=Clunio marinus TaxID=568069 RepID=A0A1J1HKQ6_9DIPT|nr:CLUMA_CG000822, isoform A [Clunio marinus]
MARRGILVCILISTTIASANFLKSLNLKSLAGEAENLIEIPTKVLAKFSTFEILKFNEFEKEYNKRYLNVEDKIRAITTFVNNLRDILDHNFLYETNLTSFRRDVWENSDLTTEDVNEKMNRFIKPIQTRELKNDDIDVVPPEKLDWVTQGLVGAVQNQGLCGSCWSFSAVGALEGQICKKLEKFVKLSEQNLIDCNRDDDAGNYGCSGGDMVTAYNYMLSTDESISLAENYPYKAGDAFDCITDIEKSKYEKISSFESIQPGDEELLKKFCAKFGPIGIAVDASLASFQSYKEGVYFDDNCSSSTINHAVLLVGYGSDQKTGKDFWLVKNSYGEKWGEDGYIRMARNSNNHCGITEFGVVPIAADADL